MARHHLAAAAFYRVDRVT